ncbi:hypothetical protein [Microlunatus sagamiharensis]|uniref:hypothetical protein n=1 Tax=Microlunatus sagamiharensis TaxID=546874 RepID=UPI0012FD7D88|nr:hypothetical protein [Microlunatus sagamiharensis]
MEKLGMRHVRTEHRTWDDPLPGADQGEVVYEIDAEGWRAGARSRGYDADHDDPGIIRQRRLGL